MVLKLKPEEKNDAADFVFETRYGTFSVARDPSGKPHSWLKFKGRQIKLVATQYKVLLLTHRAAGVPVDATAIGIRSVHTFINTIAYKIDRLVDKKGVGGAVITNTGNYITLLENVDRNWQHPSTYGIPENSKAAFIFNVAAAVLSPEDLAFLAYLKLVHKERQKSLSVLAQETGKTEEALVEKFTRLVGGFADNLPQRLQKRVLGWHEDMAVLAKKIPQTGFEMDVPTFGTLRGMAVAGTYALQLFDANTGEASGEAVSIDKARYDFLKNLVEAKGADTVVDKTYVGRARTCLEIALGSPVGRYLIHTNAYGEKSYSLNLSAALDNNIPVEKLGAGAAFGFLIPDVGLLNVIKLDKPKKIMEADGVGYEGYGLFKERQHWLQLQDPKTGKALRHAVYLSQSQYDTLSALYRVGRVAIKSERRPVYLEDLAFKIQRATGLVFKDRSRIALSDLSAFSYKGPKPC